MNPRPWLVVLLVWSWLSPALPAQQEAIRFERAYQRLDQFALRAMQTDRTPGMAVALTGREGLLRVSTYGCADLGTREPVSADTLFEIGSISKSFTAIALLQLREQGKLDLNAPIDRYLPWFSIHSEFDPITPHHLLSHTAGIPRDRDDIPSSLYQAASLRERSTGSAPGSYYAYSNIGFQVLGYLVEELTRRPYAEVIRESIFEPVGMDHSEAAITNAIRPKLAVGYVSAYDDRPEPSNQDPPVPGSWVEYGAGDGSICATAADLAAYLRMLLNRGAAPGGRVLSEESFQLLTQRVIQNSGPTEPTSYYGYGLVVREVDGHQQILHGGGMIGYSSMLLGDLTDGLGAVVLVNGPGYPGAVARFALQLLQAASQGRDLPELPKQEPLTKVEHAADYAGSYTGPGGATLELRADGDQLWLLHQNERILLEPRGEDHFFVPHPDFALFLLSFGRNQDQAVVEASFGPDWYAGERYTGPRSFELPSGWEAYPGHYRTQQPWFTNFRIVPRKGALWLITPEGDEEALEPLQTGEGALFRVGADKESAEGLRFDTLMNGKALRANLSGVDYYRTFTP